MRPGALRPGEGFLQRLATLSIRTQLLLLAAVVALPAAGVIVLSGLRQRAEARARAGLETQRLAEGIAARVHALTAGAEQVVTVLAQLPGVRRHDPRVQQALRDVVAANPDYSNVFIADAAGNVWASVVATVGFNVADRRYFRNAVASGHVSSGEYVISRATSRPALNLGYPLRDEEGRPAGAVCVGLSLEAFRRVFRDSQLDRGANFVLLDHRGVILLRAVDEGRLAGKPYPQDRFEEMARGGDADTFEGPGLDGDARIVSYRKLWLAGEDEPFLYVRVGIPVGIALAAANHVLARNLSLFLSSLLLAFALAAVLGKRSIADPVAALEAASRRVAAGEPGARASDAVRGGELGRLAATFDAMALEIASREQALLHAQKMESVGRLAGGVAHDFNNMLSVILGEAELIRSSLPEGHPCRESADEIARAAARSRDVTRQLLAFSRKQVAAPRPIDLNAAAAATRPTLARLIGEQLELALAPAAGLWAVRLDPAQLDQILVNLVVNARDAMPDGGRITIETANVSAPEGGVAPPPAGDWVCLSVRDEGTGMDPETVSHLFEPFFTTKRVGRGTGLGLATVYGIVTQNGGHVQVESAPGRGSTFRVYLPRTDAPITPEAPEPARAAAAGAARGKVLLVEDEPLVRATTGKMLESIGYEVTPAASPAEALALCARGDLAFDVLLTDVVMPEMHGTELRRRVEAIRPGLRTVFMSGYTSDAGAANGDCAFVQKPFSAAELARELSRTLA